MRVQDVMTQDIKTVNPAMKAEDAWNLLRVHGIHHLVVTEANQVVGIVSDRDLGGRRGSAVRSSRAVADLMTAPVMTVEPETTVKKAANLMRGHSVGCLVVADHKKPRGIVTVSDLLDLIGRGLEARVRTTRRHTLHHRVPHKPGAGSTALW